MLSVDMVTEMMACLTEALPVTSSSTKQLSEAGNVAEVIPEREGTPGTLVCTAQNNARIIAFVRVKKRREVQC